MPVITNPVFDPVEKAYLEWMLAYDFPERMDVVEQLNNMKEADVTRDVTPWHWIMEFRPSGVNPGYGPMRSYMTAQARHGDGAAPTVFTLYERDGFVFELEIYNADSSSMNLDAILDGDTERGTG